MTTILVILIISLIITFVIAYNKSKSINISSSLSDKSYSDVVIPITFNKSDSTKGEYLIVDIETTGLPKRRFWDVNDSSNWPDIVSIAWILFDKTGDFVEEKYFILKQTSPIPKAAVNVHRITDKICRLQGVDPVFALSTFSKSIINTKFIISHNIEFDIPIIESSLIKFNIPYSFVEKEFICTMKRSRNYVDSFRNGQSKNPNLGELYSVCTAHNLYSNSKVYHHSLSDVKMTAKSFFYLLHLEEIDPVIDSTPTWNDSNPIKKFNHTRAHAVIVSENEFIENSLIAGKKFVVTGTFNTMTRDQVRFEIIRRKGKAQSTISQHVDFVVAGNSPGPQKITDTHNLINSGSKIRIISEYDLKALFSDDKTK